MALPQAKDPTRKKNGGRYNPQKLAAMAATRDRNREIYNKWLNGTSQRDLSKEYGISQVSISNACREIEEFLNVHLAERIEQKRTRQTSRLENIYLQAMKAWTDSPKCDRSAKHLQTALNALDLLDKVQGLSRPDKEQPPPPPPPAGDVHNHLHLTLSEEQRRGLIKRIAADAARTIDATTGNDRAAEQSGSDCS